jgi:D-inositol-3-phosphate glycosyltransferase
MAKILYCGDCAVQTGFGRVAEGLLPILAKEHEIVVLAVNYWGDPHGLPYRLYPAMVGGSDPYGSHRIAEIVAKEKPRNLALIPIISSSLMATAINRASVLI